MPFPNQPLLPLPSGNQRPRTVMLNVAHADRIRAASDARFPRTSPPVRSLHTALDDAEAARTVSITLTLEDAVALRKAAASDAPDLVRDAHQHLVRQLRVSQADGMHVSLSVRHARALHAHHRGSRKVSCRTIRALIERAEPNDRSLRVTLPWDAALIVDTLRFLAPNDDALLAATRAA